MNLYLSFDHTAVEGGKTYYYFRSGIFHGNLYSDLLLLLPDVSLVDLLDVPTTIPSALDEGTLTQHFDGTSYEVPVDLYLLFTFDLSIASVGDTVLNFLEDAVSRQVMCVYTEFPVTTESDYPAGFSPDDHPPNVGAYPGWYVPALSTSDHTIASRYNNTPFWTQTAFELWFAYGDLGTEEYNCEGLPYNIHVTCFPAQYDEYIPVNSNKYHYWKYTGAARNIRSNLEGTGWRGRSITYNSGSPLSSLVISLWNPSSDDDPVIYFVPPATYQSPSQSPWFSLLPLFISGAKLLTSFASPKDWAFCKRLELSAELFEAPLGAGGDYPMGAGGDYPMGGIRI